MWWVQVPWVRALHKWPPKHDAQVQVFDVVAAAADKACAAKVREINGKNCKKKDA